MIYAQLQRSRLYLCVSLLVIAALCLALWTTTLSVSQADVAAMLSQQQKLTAPDGTSNTFFGSAVAIDGDTIVVGASPVGAVYVFVQSGGVWSLQQKVQVAGGGGFGTAVAISGDTFVAGAFGEDSSAGAARVFVRSGGVWTEQQRLIASDRMANDNFGIAVGISGDTIVVGARFSNGGPQPQQGSAYVFERTGGMWSEQQHLTAPDGGVAEFYGDAVAISGNTLLVGAAAVSTEVPQQEHGKAYVYFRAGSSWSLQQELVSGVTLGENLFGSSVSIDANTAVVGALFGNVAYVFERTGATWGSPQPITGGFGDFSVSVSVRGDTVVVGARNQKIGNNFGQGAAFVFTKESGQWSEQQMLIASDGAANDRFGNSVGISGDMIIIGSPFDQVGENEDQGSAYIFSPNGPPAITTSPVAVQQGRTVFGANIANVSDNETLASALTVSVLPGGTATGITLNNITNIDGAITADVVADCLATSGTVRLGVTDTGGLTSEADLQVMVIPNDPPMITCPANLIAKSATPGSAMAIVSYPSPVVTDDCGVASTLCNPPSGSSFPLGTTTVTCTATDTSGNTAQCGFTVTLFDICLQDDSNTSRVLLFISSGSQAGEYRFCCGSTLITGRGTATRKGSTFTLIHNLTDRRVQASVDTSIGRGSALLQSPSGFTLCSITDRNTRDNSCECGGS